jgi:hypothetical protein
MAVLGSVVCLYMAVSVDIDRICWSMISLQAHRHDRIARFRHPRRKHLRRSQGLPISAAHSCTCDMLAVYCCRSAAGTGHLAHALLTLDSNMRCACCVLLLLICCRHRQPGACAANLG